MVLKGLRKILVLGMDINHTVISMMRVIQKIEFILR